MYTNLVFIGYITMLILSILCLGLITLVLVDPVHRTNSIFKAVRNLELSAFLFGLIYFIFYYREVVNGIPYVPVLMRIADYGLECLMLLSWFALLSRFASDYSEEKKRFFISAAVLLLVKFISSVYFTSVHMNGYYIIEDGALAKAWAITESVITALLLVILVLSALYSIRLCLVSVRQKYIIFCTIILVIHAIQHTAVDAGMAVNKFGESAWDDGIIDFAMLTMLALSIATIIYVFREDFSPLYLTSIRKEVPEISEKHSEDDLRLDILSAKSLLTVREHEVMKLIYEGHTYADIAQQLFISINTVKKHVKNIYSKIGIGSRTELAELVKLQTPEDQ